MNMNDVETLLDKGSAEQALEQCRRLLEADPSDGRIGNTFVKACLAAGGRRQANLSFL